MSKPVIRAFFDEPTNTVSYLVADPQTKLAAMIDPVLDYDPKAGTVDVRSVSAMMRRPKKPDIQSSGRSKRTRTPTTCLVRPT